MTRDKFSKLILWFVIAFTGLSLLLAINAGATDLTVIPPAGDRNAQILIDGQQIDACMLAAQYADDAQAAADRVEDFMNTTHPSGSKEVQAAMAQYKALIEKLLEEYGYQELAVSICLGRKPILSRLPEDWQVEFEQAHKPKKEI